MSLINKVTELSESVNDLKVKNKMLDNELESVKKENAELKEHMSKVKLIGEDAEESNQILEELQKLRSIKKDRDEILQDLDIRSKTMRQTETQLKMKQNELEILQNTHQVALEKLDGYKKKLELMDTEIRELRSRAEKAEKDKETIEIDSKNKIEIMQYKLLNKFESDDKQDDVAFEELLNICKSDLEDILTKIQGKASNEDVEEELRREILDDAKKLNEMKTNYEQENYENLKKIDELATKIEEEKRNIQRKYKDEIEDKNHTISVLKASEGKYKVEIEKK